MRKQITRRLWLIALFGGITFFAKASPPPPDTVRTAIKKDVVLVYCVDTSNFEGNMVSFSNICTGSSGTAINFVPLDNYCISYGGMELGTEPACLVYCDDQGVCDTTIFEVTVVPDSVSTLYPLAVDDDGFTTQNNTIDIDILDNDILPNNGIYTSVKLLSGPQFGTAFFAGELTYTPNSNFCGANDTIEYEVCNIAGCDTAIVNIVVDSCVTYEGIYVFNGFSPNEDGKNDTWQVLGLNSYPNHHIRVFNRWGSSVFDKQEYESDWDGTWEGTALPPGTYFYLIEDGEGKNYTGYIQINY